MKKENLLIYSRMAILAALLVLLAAASYAWFVTGAKVDGIIIQTGYIDTEVKLYSVSDFNLDGVFDLDESGEVIAVPITEIEIADMNPGEKFTYRIDITNTGNIDGILTVSIGGFSGELADVLYTLLIYPEGYGGQYLNGLSEVVLLEDFQLNADETIVLYFQIEFCTVERLAEGDISYNDTHEGFNYYRNSVFGISTLTVNLTQTVEASSAYAESN